MNHWSDLNRHGLTVCGEVIPVGMAAFAPDAIRVFVRASEWGIIDCPTCAPIAREHWEASQAEQRERLSAGALLEINQGAERVRETAFAVAWVHFRAVSELEQRALYCEQTAQEAAHAWRTVEGKRRLA